MSVTLFLRIRQGYSGSGKVPHSSSAVSQITFHALFSLSKNHALKKIVEEVKKGS